jgi:hypothetical protein
MQAGDDPELNDALADLQEMLTSNMGPTVAGFGGGFFLGLRAG